MGGNKALSSHKMNRAVTSAYEVLAVNLKLAKEEDSRKTTSYVMTSCSRAEGKTSIAYGLAKTMASSGFKTLLVDGDMRKPLAAKKIKNKGKMGLSDILLGKCSMEDALLETDTDNLHYISSGCDNKNPIALLMGNRFSRFVDETERVYNIVIFDSPAIEDYFDAAIIASNVDSTILVVKKAKTSLKSLEDVKDKLEKIGAHIAGVVINSGGKSKRTLNLRDYEKGFVSGNMISDEGKCGR